MPENEGREPGTKVPVKAAQQQSGEGASGQASGKVVTLAPEYGVGEYAVNEMDDEGVSKRVVEVVSGQDNTLTQEQYDKLPTDDEGNLVYPLQDADKKEAS